MMTTGISFQKGAGVLEDQGFGGKGEGGRGRGVDAGKWAGAVVYSKAKPEVGPMNKRVTLDMPEEMHQLVLKYAAEAGTEPDAYLLEMIEEQLEDAYFLRRAQEVLEARERGESRTYTWEEMERELGVDD
jgi:RHH-type rel operon transcriptional repressor/antitoxin RelB